MGDERYYRDAPRFPQRDPLTTWSIIFVALGGAAVLWMLLIFFLTAGGHVRGAPDSAFGLDRTAWIVITVLLLGASILGLLFTILARLGTTEGGSYLSTLDNPTITGRRPGRPRDDTEEPSNTAIVSGSTQTDSPSPPEAGGEGAPIQSAHSAQVLRRTAARVETTSGPDGRILLSYTVPADQPRGLYGDTYIPIDSDAVLNIKTLLAKTPNV
jgi:hypothetical protein